ncbi:uncharacterized protein LOC119970891 [Scyliorhinus canicula]|uniref:uncharacterized protein LOC119970891 n=1 Tax=Scyliorhinus canicula TaxID=7830 RepID=UPI0018F44FA6|nr:uncharacterized protein LOC119970891 [Scyliorhinus canicula]
MQKKLIQGADSNLDSQKPDKGKHVVFNFEDKSEHKDIRGTSKTKNANLSTEEERREDIKILIGYRQSWRQTPGGTPLTNHDVDKRNFETINLPRSQRKPRRLAKLETEIQCMLDMLQKQAKTLCSTEHQVEFEFEGHIVIVEAEFTFCGYLHSKINKFHHDIGSGSCSLTVSINPTGLEIKARLIENGSPICMEDIAATTSKSSSEICITWKEHVGQLFLTHGDDIRSYSTGVGSDKKCCQNFILTQNTSNNGSSLLNDIIYINGTDFSPVHIENASHLEFTGSEGVCESPLSDCINQKDKLIQLAGNAELKLNDARYAMLLTNRILEDCNESISVGLESNLNTVMMKMTFSEDNKTFVTPNVEAGVIKDLSGSSDFNVIANFSWVGAEVQMVYAGVRVKYKISSLPQRAVVTHLKNKTTIQGQERIPVSPSVTVQLGTSSIVGLTTPLTITAPGLTVIQVCLNVLIDLDFMSFPCARFRLSSPPQDPFTVLVSVQLCDDRSRLLPCLEPRSE